MYNKNFAQKKITFVQLLRQDSIFLTSQKRISIIYIKVKKKDVTVLGKDTDYIIKKKKRQKMKKGKNFVEVKIAQGRKY